MEEKTFAFLIDCPAKGKFMMFPDYAENLQEELNKYQEVDVKITDLRWSAVLANSRYKVYKQKSKPKNTRYDIS